MSTSSLSPRRSRSAAAKNQVDTAAPEAEEAGQDAPDRFLGLVPPWVTVIVLLLLVVLTRVMRYSGAGVEILLVTILGLLVISFSIRGFVKAGNYWLASPLGVPSMYVIVSLWTVVISTFNPESMDAYSAFGRGVKAGFGPYAATAALAFIVGAGTIFTRTRRPVPPIDKDRLAKVARIGLALAGLLTFYFIARSGFSAVTGVVSGSGIARGSGQAVKGLGGFLRNLATILLPGLVIALAAAAPKQSILPKRSDYLLVAAPAVFLLITGSRGDPFTVLLVLYTVAVFKNRIGLGLSILLAAGGVILSATIVLLRSGISSWGFDIPSIIDITDRTVGSARDALLLTFTNIPDLSPYAGGSTFVEDFLRLLPSPVALALFGQPKNTGAYAFRELIAWNNPNAGTGFGLLAEGYMNFGTTGLVLLAGGVGLLFAFLWSRFTLYGYRAMTLMYVVTMASFPSAWRADALSIGKLFLYNFLLLGAMFIYSKPRRVRRRPTGHLRPPDEVPDDLSALPPPMSEPIRGGPPPLRRASG